MKDRDKNSPSAIRALARGVALFLGAFALLNAVAGAWLPHFDANLWWLDLRFLPWELRWVLFVAAASGFVVLAWHLPEGGRSRKFAAGFLLTAGLVALANMASFYQLLARGAVRSGFPVPLSFFILVALAFVLRAMWRPALRVPTKMTFRWMAAGFAACVLLFPLAQMICFGKTDYRREADVAVVLGARAYANGRPSDALADRVRTACALYRQGTVHKLIFSGGPGDGVYHETEVMRALAVQLGVKAEDILLDKAGVNTQATVDQTMRMLNELRARRVLVVSHFYHLPRIKLAYQRAGQEVYTVPAEEPRILRQLPFNLARETVAFWAYYFRPLTG